MCIPHAWVEAGRELHRRLAGRVRRGRPRAGLDVGAGRAESVLVLRDGPLVHPPEVRLDPDTIEVAWWALGRCGRRGARELSYDSVGVGHGLGAAFARTEMADLEVHAVNVGEPASGAVWPDGRTPRAKFANLRAELWWKAREALGRSRDLLRQLRGEPEGVVHPLGEVLIEDKERLRRLAPALRRAGLGVEFARDMHARTIRLEDVRGTASSASSPSWNGSVTGAHDAHDADDAPWRPSSGQGAQAHAEPEPEIVL